MKKIKRALISVSNKSGLVEMGKSLDGHGVDILSTGGTLKVLLEAGIKARAVEDYTGFPEMLGGRVKTLHPKIHGGILAVRSNDNHKKSLNEHDILEIDLVIINLYPFEEVVQKDNVSLETAIENIDIGGPTMIRSAAKNYADVAVVTNVTQYEELVSQLDKNNGSLSQELRFNFSVAAFRMTANYDSAISNFFFNKEENNITTPFPMDFPQGLSHVQDLRYGENPHQKAAYFLPSGQASLPWENLHGKELSYNNLIDLDAAVRVGLEFKESVCAIFKHTNPCGISSGHSQLENLERAIACDPVSYFGGIALFNETVLLETAKKLNESFFEIIVAPKYDADALIQLQKKKNLRIIKINNFASQKYNEYELKNAAWGVLAQQTDLKIIELADLKIVTEKQASEQDLEELLFAFKTVKYVKSNAIIFTRDKQTLGIGAGQMSRVDSMRFAIEKAKIAGLDLSGSYLGSDAFFPFRDGVAFAIKAGVKGIIQPGGSMRDQESIDACNEAGIVMAFTGIRHFRH